MATIKVPTYKEFKDAYAAIGAYEGRDISEEEWKDVWENGCLVKVEGYARNDEGASNIYVVIYPEVPELHYVILEEIEEHRVTRCVIKSVLTEMFASQEMKGKMIPIKYRGDKDGK